VTVVGSKRDPRRDWKPVAASVFKPRMSLVLQSLLPHPDSCKGTQCSPQLTPSVLYGSQPSEA
jgi:hypothetical protein